MKEGQQFRLSWRERLGAEHAGHEWVVTMHLSWLGTVLVCIFSLGKLGRDSPSLPTLSWFGWHMVNLLDLVKDFIFTLKYGKSLQDFQQMRSFPNGI